MKRLVLLFIMLFLLTGCTSVYEIEFGDSINEKITINYEGNIYDDVKELNLDGDNFYYEYELVNSDIPSLTGFEDYYNKDIKLKDGMSVITLDYEYKYDNLEKSYLINECFEKKSFINKDDYYYLSLGGVFSCYNIDHFTLKMKSDYKIIKGNYDREENGYYIWDIKDVNSDNKVELQISKTIKDDIDTDFKFSFKLFFGIVIGIVFVAFLVLKKRLELK